MAIQHSQVNHLPLLEIETGYDLHSRDDIDEYQIRIKNRGNAVALNPRFGLNVHPINRANSHKQGDLSENWEPVLSPLRGEERDGLSPINKIEPGEEITVTVTPTVRENWPVRDKAGLVEIIPTSGSQESDEQIEPVNKRNPVEDSDAVLWQAVISYDTLLPTQDTLYRFHQPLQIESPNGYGLLEESQYIPNLEEIVNTTSIQEPDTYDEYPFN